jgi:hypothetical protein
MAREPDLPALRRGAQGSAARVLAGALWLSGCATAAPARDAPAVITGPTPEGRAELVRVVSQALHAAPVTLGDDALVREDTLIVDRARIRGADGVPLTGRDSGRPERFRLVANGGACVLVHEGSGHRFPLLAVTCAAATGRSPRPLR